MTAPTNSFQQILHEICQAESISIQGLSAGWVQKLQKSDQIRYIVGHKFGLNPQSAGLIADDKYATFAVLRAAGLPIIEHALLYDFSNQEAYAQGRNSLDYVKSYLAEHNNHIVAKPNNGTRGRGVCYIQHPDEILPAMEIVFHSATSASLCPFCEITHKYRFVILDGEVRLAFVRRANISGSKKMTSGQFYQDLSKLALATARALNLRFCSVDFIQLPSGKIHIIEVNSGVMLKFYLEAHPDDYNLIKNIYRDAIHRMFEIKSNANQPCYTIQ